MWRKKDIPIRLVSASRCENWKTENERVYFYKGEKVKTMENIGKSLRIVFENYILSILI